MRVCLYLCARAFIAGSVCNTLQHTATHDNILQHIAPWVYVLSSCILSRRPCVCAYMCVHTCVYIHVCTYMCVHTCVYIHVCSCMFVHPCVCIYMGVQTREWIHVCVHTCVYIHLCTHMYMYTYVYIHVNLQIYASRDFYWSRDFSDVVLWCAAVGGERTHGLQKYMYLHIEFYRSWNYQRTQ